MSETALTSSVRDLVISALDILELSVTLTETITVGMGEHGGSQFICEFLGVIFGWMRFFIYFCGVGGN